jgi:signal transduction histidine kinase
MKSWVILPTYPKEMALALHIVNLLKGSITVKSAVGKGTKVIVELPR